MTLKKIAAISALAIPFALAGCTHTQTVVYTPPPPPAELSPAAQQGYHDGIDAARRDIARSRRPMCSVTPGSATHPCLRPPSMSTVTASAPDTTRPSAAARHQATDAISRSAKIGEHSLSDLLRALVGITCISNVDPVLNQVR